MYVCMYVCRLCRLCRLCMHACMKVSMKNISEWTYPSLLYSLFDQCCCPSPIVYLYRCHSDLLRSRTCRRHRRQFDRRSRRRSGRHWWPIPGRRFVLYRHIWPPSVWCPLPLGHVVSSWIWRDDFWTIPLKWKIQLWWNIKRLVKYISVPLKPVMTDTPHPTPTPTTGVVRPRKN